MSKFKFYDWIFIAYILFGVTLMVSSSAFYINHLPFSGTCAVIMGLVFVIGATMDWKSFKKRVNQL